MKRLTILLAALAATSGGALAANNYWTGMATPGNWAETNRWTLGVTPNNADTGMFLGGTITMNTDNTADSCDKLYMGSIGAGYADTILNIESGAKFLVDGIMPMGRGGPHTSTLNQSGGTATITSLKMGNTAGSGLCTVNVSGGTMNLLGNYNEIGQAADAVFNINGGTVNVNTGQYFLFGKPGATGTLNLSSGALNMSAATRIYLGETGSSATGIFNQTGGSLNIDKIQLSHVDSTSLYSISGGSVNIASYVKSFDATGKAVFEVDGSGATDIEIGMLSLESETFRVNLDSGGSTLIEVDSQGAYNDGLVLVNAVFELSGSGFDSTPGTVYDIAWAADGVDTNGMVFTDLTSLGSGTSWKLSVASGTFEGTPGEYLRATVVSDTLLGAWMVDYDITDLLADTDGNGLDNLTEFGLGGNPTNGLVDVHAPATALSGSSLNYVYPMRSGNSGVSYYLETTDNLVSGVWANAGYTVSGTNTDGYAVGFDAVTNQMDTSVKDEQFIRLRIQEL